MDTSFSLVSHEDASEDASRQVMHPVEYSRTQERSASRILREYATASHAIDLFPRTSPSSCLDNNNTLSTPFSPRCILSQDRVACQLGLRAVMSFPESPVSARMTKAAFFRARSPPQPIGDRPSPTKGYFPMSSDNDLASRLVVQTRLEESSGDRYSPASPPGINGYGDHFPRQQQQQQQQQHQQPTAQRIGDSRLPYDENERESEPMSQASSSRHLYGRLLSPEPPLSPASLQSSTSTAPRPLHKSSSMSNGFAHDVVSPDVSYLASTVEPLGESKLANIGGGSDEMLMSLLAGQAAVDCERLPVGDWEEVELWKKASCRDTYRCLD